MLKPGGDCRRGFNNVPPESATTSILLNISEFSHSLLNQEALGDKSVCVEVGGSLLCADCSM